MNHSQDNGNMTADVHSTTETLRDSQNTRVSAERAAYSQLQQWNRLLERKLAERTQELGRSLVDLRSLATALDAAEQRERTRLATIARLSGAVTRARPYETRTAAATPSAFSGR